MPGSNRALSIIPANEIKCTRDETSCICIIQDLTTEQKRKQVQNLSYLTTVHELFEIVSKKLHYVGDTFAMTFSKNVPMNHNLVGFVPLDRNSTRTLSDVGFQSKRQKNYVQVQSLEGSQPKPTVDPIFEDSTDEGTTSTSWSYSSSNAIPPPPPVPCKSTATQSSIRRNAVTENSAFSFSESISRAASQIKGEDFKGVDEKSRLRGLVNQAMTCYLNSLIQTLYMTPEFRNALYMWEFSGTEEEAVTTIPYQLQRLFLAMQTSEKQAVETTDLTKSFGWDSSEAWQQHDIQELCRVMFDALEQKFAKTEQAEIIKLYEGKLKDYVQCSECKNESARMDTFLDIPITLRPFGSTRKYKSVTEGLEAFVEPETLDGSNQYFCEKCNKKCNAKKGLKFVTFPYLLTLQLKRFDFDYSTMHRVKLNDRMFFPEELDLNAFVENEEVVKDTVSDPGSDCVEEEDAVEENIVGELRIDEEGDYSSRDSGNDDDRPYSGGTGRKRAFHHSSDDSEEGSSVDEGIDIESQKSYGVAIPGISGTGQAEEDSGSGSSTPGAVGGVPKKEGWDGLQDKMEGSKTEKKKGPFVYELFSVMIHSGSAIGGHYYAYIKSFDDGQWYSFNDQVVSPIQLEDIEKSYGGAANRNSYHSSFSSSTNAYMLMYRQYDKDRNTNFIPTEDLPEHIKQLAEKERENEVTMKMVKEKERNMCTIKVYCRHQSLLTDTDLTIIDESYEFHNATTLRDATEEIYKLFKLDRTGVKLANCRVVKYDSYHQSLDQSIDDEEENQDIALSQLLGGSHITSYLFDLLLETREDDDEEFQVYKPGGITVKVFVADYDKGCFMDEIIVRLMQTETIYHLKQLLAKRLHCPLPRIRMAYEKYSCDVQLLTNAAKTLKDIGFFRSVKIYMDIMTDEDYSEIMQADEQGSSSYASDTSRNVNIKETRLWTLIDRASNLIHVNVTLPEDVPFYELPPRPPTPPIVQLSTPPPTPPRLPITVPPPPASAMVTSDDNNLPIGESNESSAAVGSTPSSDEGLGSYDGSSSTNGDTTAKMTGDLNIPPSLVNPMDSNSDDITLFWRSPEQESFNDQEEFSRLQEEGRRLDDEVPLPSDSTHLRRNSENESWSDGNQAYFSISAGDFQAELDRKFLAAGYTQTSPTSSLRCEDGSSDSDSQTSGEFEIPTDSLRGDGATDSAGSCSTIDSTDTLCNNNEVDAPALNAEDQASHHSYSSGQESSKDHYSYSYLAVPSATKSCALPGMARFVHTNCSAIEIDTMELDDGRVDKPAITFKLDVVQDGCGLCQCRRNSSPDSSARPGAATSNVSIDSPPQDTGPGYQCSKCHRLKPQCVFASDFDTTNKSNADAMPLQDPECGEGLDNIMPLFNDLDFEEKGAGDSVTDGKLKYVEMNTISQMDSEMDSGRQRTESVSSAVSDLGYGDQLHHNHCYFRVCSVSVNDQKCQVLRAKMDKRTTVGWLKRQIHPIIHMQTRQFSIYRVFQSGQETELNSLGDNFSHVPDETRLRVKHERALRRNEHRCKVFNLVLTENDSVKHLVDWVVRRGLTVREAHCLISEELFKQCEMNVPAENIRLRKKCWRNAGKIFLSSDKFGGDIMLGSNLEIFLEILPHPDRKTNHEQLVVYCRRWRPSTFTLGPFQEVILEADSNKRHTVEELKLRLSDISDLAATDIEWSKPHSIFPCHMNVLEIQDLDWEPMFCQYLDNTPTNITEDGAVIFYRDKNEEEKAMTNQERSELQSKETARMSVVKNFTSSSNARNGGSSIRPYARKERALKIYTVDNNAKKAEITTTL